MLCLIAKRKLYLKPHKRLIRVSIKLLVQPKFFFVFWRITIKIIAFAYAQTLIRHLSNKWCLRNITEICFDNTLLATSSDWNLRKAFFIFFKSRGKCELWKHGFYFNVSLRGMSVNRLNRVCYRFGRQFKWRYVCNLYKGGHNVYICNYISYGEVID